MPLVIFTCFVIVIVVVVFVNDIVQAQMLYLCCIRRNCERRCSGTNVVHIQLYALMM